jgi:hypothetical protein
MITRQYTYSIFEIKRLLNIEEYSKIMTKVLFQENIEEEQIKK